MLDMGFIPDIEEICTKLPKQRQTLLFSATMPPPIKKLADKFLIESQDDRGRAPGDRPTSTSSNGWCRSPPSKKRDKLRRAAARRRTCSTAIIFCNRKTTVRELNKALQQQRLPLGRDPWRHGAVAAHRRARPVQGGRGQHPRRLRRRRARARHQGRQPRLQFRRAVASRRLRPPHRPHRPRGRDRHRLSRWSTPEDAENIAEYREADRPEDRPPASAAPRPRRRRRAAAARARRRANHAAVAATARRAARRRRDRPARAAAPAPWWRKPRADACRGARRRRRTARASPVSERAPANRNSLPRRAATSAPTAAVARAATSATTAPTTAGTARSPTS